MLGLKSFNTDIINEYEIFKCFILLIRKSREDLCVQKIKKFISLSTGVDKIFVQKIYRKIFPFYRPL